MSYLAGLLGAFNDRRTAEFDRNMAEERRLGDQEFALLSTLAQHEDPQLAALGGAGLLELIKGGGKPNRKSGLRGFLGEVERSSFMPQIRAALGQQGGGQPAPIGAPPAAGGAAMPGASPVEPKAQAGPQPLQLGGLPSTAQGAMPMEGPEEALGPGAPPPLLPAAPTMPLPPPPESQAQRIGRLFPSASELASQKARAEVYAKYTSIAQALRQAGSTPEQVRRGVAGALGAPEPYARPEMVQVTYLGPDGQPVQAIGLSDPNMAQITVDGQPVQAISATKIAAPRAPARPIRQSMSPDGKTRTDMLLDPTTLAPLAQFDTGIPVQAPPSPYSGTATIAGPDGTPQVVQVNRDGGAGPVVGTAPARPGQGSPETAEATGFLASVNAELKRLEKQRGSGMRSKLQGNPGVPAQERDRLTSQLTQGKFPTYAALVAATKRSTGNIPPAPAGPGAPSGPPAFGSPEGAAAIEAAIRRRQGGQ